ncbi:hypothetical protein [Herbiconiux liangxiaofengii]|uniref:hypothetical protein n=1 Tax=Herbiconiux liangxiaofengii TaxID=3342795 RepID=UPI0035BB871E
MTGRHLAAAGSALVAGCLLTALAGCVAAAGPDGEAAAPSAPATSSPGPRPTSAGSSGSYSLDGAGPDTPECQPASAAVMAAVNATISNPLPGGANAVDALLATPDPEHAVWLLAGTIPSTSTAGGYVVAWATTTDPTTETFDGVLRSVGGTTSTVSSATGLQFPDWGQPGGFPPAVLECMALLPDSTGR